MRILENLLDIDYTQSNSCVWFLEFINIWQIEKNMRTLTTLAVSLKIPLPELLFSP